MTITDSCNCFTCSAIYPSIERQSSSSSYVQQWTDIHASKKKKNKSRSTKTGSYGWWQSLQWKCGRMHKRRRRQRKTTEQWCLTINLQDLSIYLFRVCVATTAASIQDSCTFVSYQWSSCCRYFFCSSSVGIDKCAPNELSFQLMEWKPTPAIALSFSPVLFITINITWMAARLIKKESTGSGQLI